MENARPDEPANLESVHCSACGVEFAVRGFTRGQVGMLLARHAATHSQGPVTPSPPESYPESPSSSPALGSLFSSPEGSTVADVFSDFEDNYSKYKSSYDDPGQERFGLDSDELYHSSSGDANSSAKETNSQEAARQGAERETEPGEYQGKAQGEAKRGANSDASSDSGAGTNQSASTDTSYGEPPSSSSSQSTQENSALGSTSASGSPGVAQNQAGEGRDPFPGAGPSAAPAGSRTPGANPGQGMSQGTSLGAGLPGSPSSGATGAAGGLPGAGASAGAAGAGDAASKLGDTAGSGAAPGGGYKKDIDKVLNSAQANLSDPSLSTGEALEETTRDAAKVAATAGTAAAIQYGTSGAVPEPVARKLAESKPVKALTDKAADKAVDKGLKWGKRGLKGAVLLGTAVLMPVVLMATLLVGAAVVSSTNDNSGYLWAAPIDPAGMDIPQPYAEAYYSAGVQFNIPWTLLAAVGATSSYHGRVNPYLQPVPMPVPRVTSPVFGGGFGGSGKISTLYVVGDSISDPQHGATSTDPYFAELAKQQGFVYEVHALNGMSTSWGMSQIRQYPPPPGASVVMAMGTNDGASRSGALAFRARLAEAMELLKSHNVYWVNVRWDSGKSFSHYAGNDKVINQTLVEEQGKYPNLRVLDWDGWSRSSGIETYDGLHYGADASEQRAKFIVDSIVNGAPASVPVTSPVSYTPPSPTGLTGPGVLPDPEGRCPTLPKPIEGTSQMQGYGPLMLSPAALSRSGSKVDTDDLQDICQATNTLAAVITQTAIRVAVNRKMSYPDSFRPLVEAAQTGDPGAAEYIQSFWTSVMDSLDIVGSTGDPVCTISPQPQPVATPGEPESPAGPTPDTTPRQDWIADAIGDVWACELLGQPLRSVLRASWDGSSLQYVMADRAQARARAIREAVEVAWSYSAWGEARHANRDCNPEAPLAGVFPLSVQVFSENLPSRLAGKNRCDVEANIVAAARAFRMGEVVEPASRPGGPRGWASLYGGWENFENAVTGPEQVRSVFAERGPWVAPQASEECEVRIRDYFSQALESPDNPILSLTSSQVRSYLAGGTLSAQLVTSLDSFLDGLAAEVASSGACTVDYEEQWLALLQLGAPQVEADEIRHPRASPSVADVGLAMAARLDARLDGPEGRPTPQRDRTALLQRFSPVRLEFTGMPKPPPVPSGLGTGPGYVSVAVSVYGGFYPGGLGSPVAGGFSGGNCPSVAPEGGIQDGLDAVGLAEICRQAVSQAATPQAALAIQWALNQLGLPYDNDECCRTGPSSYDCSGFVSTAYADGAGITAIKGHSTAVIGPWDFNGTPDAHYQKLSWADTRPGDLLMQHTPTNSSSEHVLMYLGEFLGQKVVVHTDGWGVLPSRVEFLDADRILYPEPGRRVVTTSKEEEQAVATLAASLGGSASLGGFPGLQFPVSGSLLAQASSLKDMRPFASGANTNANDRMGEWAQWDPRVLPGTPRAYAVSQLARFGWGIDQWPCLDRLWWYESGWKATAYDPRTGKGGPQFDPEGTWGIPQAYEAKKLLDPAQGGGPDGATNPITQINWGLTYISRYGWWKSQSGVSYPEAQRKQTPCGVWEVWRWRAQPNIDGVGVY